MSATILYANDKFRAKTRSTWIASPADSVIQVDAIPANLPTYVVLGWNTTYEALFSVTSTSGNNSSNYALTGVTWIKGYAGNLPEGIAVNCLNNEEFFNQYGTAWNEVLDIANDAAASSLTVNTIASSATPSPIITTQRNLFTITALAAASAIGVPTGTPTEGMTLALRIKDNATARALTFNAVYRFSADLPAPTTTTISKTLYVGFVYNNTDSKWDCLAILDNL